MKGHSIIELPSISEYVKKYMGVNYKYIYKCEVTVPDIADVRVLKC